MPLNPEPGPKARLNRRTFARGLGASLLAAPFVRWLSSPAQAAPGDAAHRLLVFFSPNGAILKHWRPTGSGAQFAFPKGSVLEPPDALRSDLVMVDGLDFKGADNHEGGMAAMLTGKGKASHESQGMSLDQFVAAKIGAQSRFRSLEFGVLTSPWGGQRQTRMSYSGEGKFVHPNDDVSEVYKRLWGNATAKPGEADIRLLQQKSAIDMARGDLATLRKGLGTAGKIRLDQHLESFRQMEKGLKVPQAPGGTGCQTPQKFDPYNPKDHALVPKIGKAQMDMLVMALACDMTRVATLQWSHTVSPLVCSWLGHTQGHHALSHMSDSNTAGVAQFIESERWFAEQFAYLVGLLKKTPDPGGAGTLFDTTLVVWAKEMGDPRAHVCKSVPFVLTGGGKALKRGRYLKYNGEAHQQLLVSICRMMGLNNATFGDPSLSTGPLKGLA